MTKTELSHNKSLDEFSIAVETVNATFIDFFGTFAKQFVVSVQPIIDALNGLGEYYWSGLQLELTLNDPERWEGESLADWGKRLEIAGLFDKYEYRLMYGKECWRALLHSPVWMIKMVLKIEG